MVESKYTHDYVEIKMMLEHLRTKLETIESSLHDLHKVNSEMNDQIVNNRAEIASVKATAAIVGGITGSILAVIFRLLLFS